MLAKVNHQVVTEWHPHFSALLGDALSRVEPAPIDWEFTMERQGFVSVYPKAAMGARQRLGLVVLTTIAVVASGFLTSSAVAATESPSPSPTSGSEYTPTQPSAAKVAATSGPSAESAALAQAAATGDRVEVLADDTSTTTTYANPDGTLTKAISQSPVRVRDADGNWVPVDLGLAGDANGRLVPRASPVDESFSGTGSGELASLSLDGSTSVGMSFDATLATPKVSDGTATYPFAGSDIGAVMLATTDSGFSARVQLPSAPTSAPTYTFPLTLQGLKASLSTDNRLELSNASGDLVATSAPLAMWDAQSDSGGDPTNVAPVAAALVTTGDGGTALQLTPSQDFLTAKSTHYPVTIDPDISSVTRFGDTYVDSGNPNSSAGGTDYRIRVGAYKDASNNWQTYFGYEKFRIDPLVGKDVLSATLTVHQYYSDSCTSRTTDIYATQLPTVYSGWTWNNRPAKVTGGMWNNSVSGAHGGGTSCPTADVPIDVTRQINGYTTGENDSFWSGDTADNKPYIATIALLPDNQTSANEMRFCSDNTGATTCVNAANKPVLSLTYRPLLGLDTATSTVDHRLNDAAGLHVNNDTGNAIVKSQDAHIAGIGQDLTVNRFYNSAANQTGGVGTTSLGTAGWSLSAGPDVYMQNITGYANRYDYHAPGGAVYGHYVRKDTSPPSGGGSTDYYLFYEPKYGGVDATLKDDNPGSGPDTFTLTMHASQMKYHFTQVDSTNTNLYLTSTEDRSGNTIHYNYVTGTHKLASITDTDNRSLTVAYNTAGYIHTITDNFGPVTRTWTYDYDTSGHGNLVDYIDPTGAETDYAYTLISGQYFLTTITDPEQTDHDRPTTVLSYTSGQLTEAQYQTSVVGGSPVYASFTWNYSSATNALCSTGTRSTVVTDLSDTPSGATTYCFQDLVDGTSGGRAQTQVVDAVGNRRSAQYSPDQKPLSLTSPEDDGVSNGSTVGAYGDGTTGPTDELQSVTEPNDPGTTAAADVYSYQASSSIPGYQYLPTSVDDSNGNCTSYTYVSSGAGIGLVKTATIGLSPPSHDCSMQAGPQQLHNDYNAQGQVIHTWDANGNGINTADQTVYSYNSDGEVATVTRPGGSCSTSRTLCTSYTYDGDGRVTTMTDGRGKITTYSYDKDDRVTQVLFDGATSCSHPAGTCLSYTYDGEGNLASRTDVSGTTSFSYDMLNQQSTQSLPDGSSVTTVYDAAGNLLEYDQSVHRSIGTVTDFESYSHNAANQTVSAKDNNTVGSTDVVTLLPNKNGNIRQVTYPTTAGIGSVTTSYDTAGHIKSIIPSGTSLPSYAYTWTKASQETDELQTVTTTNGQSSQDGTINYTYNASEQLTSANDSSSQPDYSFAYDNAGNMQSKTIAGSTTHFGYSEAGILCWKGATNGTQVAQSCPSTPSGDTSVNHDANGNNTGTSSTVNAYDAANRASSLGGVPQTYLDQGNNLRSGDGSGSSAMTFVSGPLGMSARVENGNVTFYIRNTDGSLLEERGASGIRYYALGLHQSVTGLIDANGSAYASYLYGPYGDTTANAESGGTTASDNPSRWDGGYQDATEGDNLYHFGARYYDPSTSNWTQPDPKTGSITHPATLEAFSYGLADPINNTDRSGRGIGDIWNGITSWGGWECVGGIVGATVDASAEVLDLYTTIILSPTVVAVIAFPFIETGLGIAQEELFLPMVQQGCGL